MGADDKRWRLVCYDVRDPKRYRKAYKIIRGHGRRLQYSVFRCRLDDAQLERLRWKLANVLDSEDALLIIDLCPGCAQRTINKNFVDDWDLKPMPFRLIAGNQAPPDDGSSDG